MGIANWKAFIVVYLATSAKGYLEDFIEENSNYKTLQMMHDFSGLPFWIWICNVESTRKNKYTIKP